jgi:hypothetical protein
MFKTKVKCLTCSEVFSVSKEEFNKAEKSKAKDSSILKLKCPACQGEKASKILKVSKISKVKSTVLSFLQLIWDKITDFAVIFIVFMLKMWDSWQYDFQAILRQLLTYFIIFWSAYIVILLTPLKNYFIALLIIVLISYLQTKQGR